MEDAAPQYSSWEAYASLFVAIDILTHKDGIRYSGCEGKTTETVKGILVLEACAIQILHKADTTDP